MDATWVRESMGDKSDTLVVRGDDAGPLHVEHGPPGAQLTFSPSTPDPWCRSVPWREK
ncbi:hypothetical protein SSPS47_29260 [Streptomyces sp. S4.7]|uniref:hypothetical protein n=1 Tax=Streptomyces sp. S4.7 TaxID=2705439 RepID=UPI0013971CEA|nr:hypothetical protein [Streptomyces sp. S4.7]QHY99198.1 hypothetical protein SSPS47_29260 [Streptomyces sp. S4.7]